MFKVSSLVKIILLFIPISVMASGGYSSGGYGDSSPKRAVDQTYERGKSLYKGRIRGVEKIKYCIADGDNRVKLKRATIKRFKGKKASELANSLYNCQAPDELALAKLTDSQRNHVLYYLNKRYKLNLK